MSLMSVDVRGEAVGLPRANKPGAAGASGLVLLRPAAAYLASRALVYCSVAFGVWRRGDSSVLRALAQWDGAWYLGVAVQGYPAAPPMLGGEMVNNNIAFFPLYPLAIRAVSTVTGLSELVAAVAVSFVAGLAAAVLLWLLVRKLCDAQAADRAVLLFCFFPGSVMLSMAYSESLMLSMSLLCLLALLERRWTAAGLSGALATASRPNAAVIAVCCLYEGVRAWRAERDWRSLIAPALAPAGFVGFMLFLWRRTGEPLVWFQVQGEGWNERFDGGVRTFQEVLLLARDPLGQSNTLTLQVLGLCFTLVALVLLLRWRPPPVLTVYTLGILALCLGSWNLGARPRFVLTAFPLIVAVARAARGRVFSILLACSAMATFGLAMLYTAPRLAIP